MVYKINNCISLIENSFTNKMVHKTNSLRKQIVWENKLVWINENRFEIVYTKIICLKYLPKSNQLNFQYFDLLQIHFNSQLIQIKVQVYIFR